MTTNTAFCIKISSFTDYKWRIQCKCKVKFTNQNCIGCCSTDLFPTSGVSYFLHEELRGKGVQNVTISSHNKVSYLAMASPFKSLMHYIFCLLCMVLYFFAFHISSFQISKINEHLLRLAVWPTESKFYVRVRIAGQISLILFLPWYDLEHWKRNFTKFYNYARKGNVCKSRSITRIQISFTKIPFKIFRIKN